MMKKILIMMCLLAFLPACAFGAAVTQGPTNFTGPVNVAGAVTTTGASNSNTYINSGGGNACVGCAKNATVSYKMTVTSTTGPDLYLPPIALLASPSTGQVEHDTTTIYGTPSGSNRGTIPTVESMQLVNSYTLSSQTAAQALFNVGTSNTGTITLSANTTYYFESMFSLTSMSATSGTFGFNIVVPSGTTYGYTAMASKTTGNSEGAEAVSYSTAANASLTAPGVGTAGVAFVKGIIRVGATGGTVQPQVSLSVSAGAVVGANSYFIVWPAGSNTTTNIGNVV